MPLEFDGVNGIIKNTTSDGDVTIKGNDGGSEISALTFDMSAEGVATFNKDIKLGDNSKALFGAASDLEIYHDGSHSYISDQGTGDLRILAANSFVVKKADASENIITANADGAVGLSYDASQKLATTATGIEINGGFTATDGCTITTADNDPQLILTSTDADADEGPRMNFVRNSGSPANNDVLARISLQGKDAGANTTSYAELETTAVNVAEGSETGKFNIKVAVAGSVNQDVITMTGSEVVINDSSNDLDFRVESNGNTHGLFVDGGNNAVLINKSSPTQNYYHLDGTIIAGFEMFGTANAAGRMSAFTYGSADTGGHLMTFGKSRSATPDNYTIVQNGDQLGRISFQGTDGTHFVAAAQIHATVDGTPGANDMPGRLSFHTTSDGGTTLSERMRIDSSGKVGIGTSSLSTTLHVNGTILGTGGVYISAFDGDKLITDASQGGGSDALFIGNAQIQVSSDARIKKDVVNTNINATEELKKVRVVDFTWDDPKDQSYNNKNARGQWTGAIAQELISIFPHIINAPRDKETLKVDNDSERKWLVEYENLVPILIKSIQELSAKNDTLEARITTLENN